MSLQFYADLPEVTDFFALVSAQSYHELPDDWAVVITDVQGSTKAIEAGRYRDVNALGVASILAIKNALSDVELPFVFGGDGATLAVPMHRLKQVDEALRGLRRLAHEAFELGLRVARVPVEMLRGEGLPLRVAKYRQSPAVALAAFSGRGFSVAEEWIKDRQHGERFAVGEEGAAEVDLTGFECRWQPVKNRNGNMVALLIVSVEREPSERERTYAQALSMLDELGCLHQGPPFEQGQMHFKRPWHDFTLEAQMRTGKSQGPEVDAWTGEARKRTQIAQLLLWANKEAGGFNGALYRQKFLENTDHRKFDEALRMVLDVSDEQLAQIRRSLQTWHDQGQLAFGTHSSKSALITCAVGDYDSNHIHFVDGSDGGYALAAKELKAQLQALLRLSRLPAGI